MGSGPESFQCVRVFGKDLGLGLFVVSVSTATRRADSSVECWCSCWSMFSAAVLYGVHLVGKTWNSQVFDASAVTE